MKKHGKALGILLLAVTAVGAACILRGCLRPKPSTVKPDYYTEFTSEAPLEQRYSQPGEYAVSSLDTPFDHPSIRMIRFWYPSELPETEERYPVIVAVNASGTPAANYEAWFRRLASWGFVVVGNEDPQTGTGETASITLDYLLHLRTASALWASPRAAPGRWPP